MKLTVTVLLNLLLTVGLFAQRTTPPSSTELSAITERGRYLYSYDEAAWHSTDAIVATKPTKDSFESYVGQKVGDKWTVVYGKLNEKHDGYLIVYEAVQGESLTEFGIKKIDPPKETKGFYLAAALALELARTDFGKTNRPYNTAVLPGPSDQLYVYILPAQTVTGIFPLGADVRYLISSDGKRIAEKRQLHKSVIEFQVPKDINPETGYHTAVLDDIPEDTDVFHVLTRSPKIPELIVTNKYVYQVKPDGAIVYVMTREAFLRVGKPSN